MVPFLALRVRCFWLFFHAESLPKSSALTPLPHNLQIGAGSLMSLQQADVLLSCGHVCLLIHCKKLAANPEEECGLRLHNAHASRVDPLEPLAALEEVLGHQFADDSLRIVVLVTHQTEDPRTHCQ